MGDRCFSQGSSSKITIIIGKHFTISIEKWFLWEFKQSDTPPILVKLFQTFYFKIRAQRTNIVNNCLKFGGEAPSWHDNSFRYVFSFLLFISYSSLSMLEKMTENFMHIYNFIVSMKNQKLFSKIITCPVGWGCRTHQLHLCRAVRPHP